MIIDAHNHPDWYGYDVDSFIKNMDENNIDVTWLLSWICPEDEFASSYSNVLPTYLPNGPIPFERVLYFKEKYPERFVVGYAPDMRDPNAIKKLQAAVSINGVKVCGEVKLRMMYDNPDAIRFFQAAGELNLPVTLHIDYPIPNDTAFPWPNFWYGGGINAVENILKSCPDTAILGHAPGFWAHISNDDQFDKISYPKGKVVEGGKLIELFLKYDNLYGDMSAGSGCNALKRDPEFALKFINQFQDRLLYARDYFDTQHQDFLNTLPLTQEVKDKIYYKNALKLIPLEKKRKK